jgi:hypothetical protein
MAPGPNNCGPTVSDEPVSVDRLTTDCPTHGTVPAHCPRCLGRRGGKRHKGTAWKRKKELDAIEKFSETTSRVLDLQPEARMLVGMAEARKRVSNIAEQLGWPKEEVELLLTEMGLSEGFRYLRQLADRMSPEDRASLREDMQKSVAVALGDCPSRPRQADGGECSHRNSTTCDRNPLTK